MKITAVDKVIPKKLIHDTFSLIYDCEHDKAITETRLKFPGNIYPLIFQTIELLIILL